MIWSTMGRIKGWVVYVARYNRPTFAFLLDDSLSVGSAETLALVVGVESETRPAGRASMRVADRMLEVFRLVKVG